MEEELLLELEVAGHFFHPPLPMADTATAPAPAAAAAPAASSSAAAASPTFPTIALDAPVVVALTPSVARAGTIVRVTGFHLDEAEVLFDGRLAPRIGGPRKCRVDYATDLGCLEPWQFKRMRGMRAKSVDVRVPDGAAPGPVKVTARTATQTSRAKLFTYVVGIAEDDLLALLDDATLPPPPRGAFLYAAGAGYLRALSALLRRGYDVDAVDGHGYTAAHRAAGTGNYDVVALLLKHGADMSRRTWDNKTAVDIAIENQHDSIVELLTPASGEADEDEAKAGEEEEEKEKAERQAEEAKAAGAAARYARPMRRSELRDVSKSRYLFSYDEEEDERAYDEIVARGSEILTHEGEKDVCAFCHRAGADDRCGRVLGPFDGALWVHENCFLWARGARVTPADADSALAIERSDDASAQHCIPANVRDEVARAWEVQCTRCGVQGAGIECAADGCERAYHYACAAADECSLLHLDSRRSTVCPVHVPTENVVRLTIHDPARGVAGDESEPVEEVSMGGSTGAGAGGDANEDDKAADDRDGGATSGAERKRRRKEEAEHEPYERHIGPLYQYYY